MNRHKNIEWTKVQAKLESRKNHRTENNAVNIAAAMRIEILTEEQYRALQKLGEFDTKTSSWIKTPDNIRKLGGSLFCDRRDDTVFVYHNGAEAVTMLNGDYEASVKTYDDMEMQILEMADMMNHGIIMQFPDMFCN